MTRPVEITCISDTHCAELELPDGDILLHAGDLTFQGKLQESTKQLEWLARQNYRYKIIVPGNHERGWESERVDFKAICDKLGIICLINKEITCMGLRIYGSPFTPEFCGWAYMREGEDIKSVWDNIPTGLDILITHGPPEGILSRNLQGEECGCPYLLEKVKEVKPRVHLFGHIHEGYGDRTIKDTRFINASIMTRQYQPVNKPVEIELENK